MNRTAKRSTRLSYLFRRLRHRIWFRAAAITLAAIAVAVASALAASLVPYEIEAEIGQDAVGTLLEIIASSMLAVTTFSLTAMVTAYGAATQLATPRATQLLISDTTSQNALSTFLGAFVFAIVGIIGLQTGLYGTQGRFVLFVGTVILIAVVVVTLLRWISHLTTFGRMSDVIDRVEDAARETMTAFAEDPTGGARVAVAIPEGAVPVFGTEAGYVTHLHMLALEEVSKETGAALHVTATPGTLVHPARELLFVEGAIGEADGERLREAFSIERHRTYDHDPRLGIIALSEIGSRALAPATNDPGTAIEVMNAMLRVLLLLPDDAAGGPDEEADPAVRVHVRRPMAEDFLEDAFAPLLREGALEAEVSIRLTKTLAAIRERVPHAAPKAGELAASLAECVRTRGASPVEIARFERSHAPLWAPERG